MNTPRTTSGDATRTIVPWNSGSTHTQARACVSNPIAQQWPNPRARNRPHHAEVVGSKTTIQECRPGQSLMRAPP